MNNKLKQFISGADKIGLTKEEKNSMRSDLVNFIRLNPATNQVFYHHAPSKQAWFLTLFNSRLAPFALSFLVLMSLGGGVSFAAEKALPGNVLYPLKVHVLEEGRAMLALTPEEKAVWASERMSLRLTEAAILASRGELDDETADEIENNFELQAENFVEQTEHLEDDGFIEIVAELNSDLEVALGVHAGILKTFAEDSDNNEIAGNLAINVDAQKENKTFVRLHMEDKVSNSSQNVAKQAAEQRLREAEDKITGLKINFEESKSGLSVEVIGKVEAKLALADKAIADGKVKFENGSYGEAFVLFGQAHRIAQETKLFIDANEEFEIDITLDTENNEEDGEEIEDTEDDNSLIDVNGSRDGSDSDDAHQEIEENHEEDGFKIDFDIRNSLGL